LATAALSALLGDDLPEAIVLTAAISDSPDMSRGFPFEIMRGLETGKLKTEEMNIISTSGLLVLQLSHVQEPIHSLPNHSPYEFPPAEIMTNDFTHVSKPIHSLPNHCPYEFPHVKRMTHDF
jgi:hypothetical protein